MNDDAQNDLARLKALGFPVEIRTSGQEINKANAYMEKAERIRLLDEYAKAIAPAIIRHFIGETSMLHAASYIFERADELVKEREKWIK